MKCFSLTSQNTKIISTIGVSQSLHLSSQRSGGISQSLQLSSHRGHTEVSSQRSEGSPSLYTSVHRGWGSPSLYTSVHTEVRGISQFLHLSSQRSGGSPSLYTSVHRGQGISQSLHLSSHRGQGDLPVFTPQFTQRSEDGVVVGWGSPSLYSLVHTEVRGSPSLYSLVHTEVGGSPSLYSLVHTEVGDGVGISQSLQLSSHRGQGDLPVFTA